VDHGSGQSLSREMLQSSGREQSLSGESELVHELVHDANRSLDYDQFNEEYSNRDHFWSGFGREGDGLDELEVLVEGVDKFRILDDLVERFEDIGIAGSPSRSDKGEAPRNCESGDAEVQEVEGLL
jgi:hypothetical protein